MPRLASFFDRFRFRSSTPLIAEPSLEASPQAAPAAPAQTKERAWAEPNAIVRNGNGLHVKAVNLGPGVVPGTPFQFFSPDGTRTIIRPSEFWWEADQISRDIAFATTAYCFVALRYRAEKLSEPPLMVVRRDREGGEKWLPGHELEELLDDPSNDYDMAELLYRTQLYLDIGGQALWVKDTDGSGARVGRLTPFASDEFSVEPSGSRIYGKFQLNTTRGDKNLPPERVVFFQSTNPSNWHEGLSLVDVMLSWLNLGHRTQRAIKNILRNGVWPSVVIAADPNWDPDDEAFEKYKEDVEAYALPENKGKPMILLGGGKPVAMQLNLANLLPADILDRIESVVASVSGVPSVVLQFLVGLKNSPWSQMSEAHRQCAVDTIRPLWTKYENRITRQLLWVPKRDRFLRIRFDVTDVAALQPDLKVIADTIKTLKESRIASQNELRAMMPGWDPNPDPAADEIPEFEAPLPMAAAPGQPGADDDEATDDDAPAEKPKLSIAKMAEIQAEQRKLAEEAEREVRWKVWDARTGGTELGWLLMASGQLDDDRTHVLRMAREELEAGKAETDKPATATSVRKLMARIQRWDLAKAWKRKTTPMVTATARQSVSAVAAEVGISFNVLQPGIAPYAQAHAAELVTSIDSTTKQMLKDLLENALTDGTTVRGITEKIADSGAFAASRAQLIARTETTAIANGAGRAALETWQKESGAAVEKSWLSARDDRVRDEHAALDDGSWIDVDSEFDNGLTEPSEPNCRCTLIYRVREDT